MEETPMDALTNLDLSGLITSLTALLSTWGIRVVGAVALLFVGSIVAKTVRRSMRRTLGRTRLDPTLIPFLSGMVYYLIVIFVVVACLGLFGIQTTSLIAVLGAAGLAVGLALQGTLTNFSSGVMLLIFRPFRLGDFVEVAGVAGSVEEIGLFSTTMNTPDNVRIIVPNSAVYGTTIKNYAANDTRRIDLVMGVSYDDDLSLVQETIEKVLRADDRILADPAPFVAVAELADSSVNFVVRPWCNRADYWGLRCDLNRRLKETLEQVGCSIPYPQTDVHLFKTEVAA